MCKPFFFVFYLATPLYNTTIEANESAGIAQAMAGLNLKS